MQNVLIKLEDSVEPFLKSDLEYFGLQDRLNDMAAMLKNVPAIFEDTFVRPVGIAMYSACPHVIIEIPPATDRTFFFQLNPTGVWNPQGKIPPAINKVMSLPTPWTYLFVSASVHPATKKVVSKVAYAICTDKQLFSPDGTYDPEALPLHTFVPNHRIATVYRATNFYSYSSVCTNYAKSSQYTVKTIAKVFGQDLLDLLSNYLNAPYNCDYFGYAVSSNAMWMMINGLEIKVDDMESTMMKTLVEKAHPKPRTSAGPIGWRTAAINMHYPNTEACNDYFKILTKLSENPHFWEDAKLARKLGLKKAKKAIENAHPDFLKRALIYQE